MRVIAGKARRLPLKTTSGPDTRPTIDRIKETLFNILCHHYYVQGSCFLDLFCGSGSIGIEALSRGAAKSVFVDSNPKAIACVRDNLTFTKLSEDAVILQKNALAAINELSIRKYKFDIIYIDPPYFAGLEMDVLTALGRSDILDEHTMVILETDRHNKLDFIGETAFEIIREKKYKTNRHYFLRLRRTDLQEET
ncbi:MAG: 16S rRNA (guanine(966)-N(2))-methyltransferase RsmD [Lachnospiraceae bacterium]|jgi:16S rRNA (guanine966-N2)-methyltransferase